MSLPEKEKYTLQELFLYLPISETKLGEKAGINKVTLYYIKTGKRKPYKSTMNRLLSAFSEVYEKPLSWDNVIVGESGQGEGKEDE